MTTKGDPFPEERADPVGRGRPAWVPAPVEVWLLEAAGEPSGPAVIHRSLVGVYESPDAAMLDVPHRFDLEDQGEPEWQTVEGDLRAKVPYGMAVIRPMKVQA